MTVPTPATPSSDPATPASVVMPSELILYDATVHNRIRNTGALPTGTGCRYLLCMRGPEGSSDLIAMAWLRKLPRKPWDKDKVVVDFKPLVAECPE